MIDFRQAMMPQMAAMGMNGDDSVAHVQTGEFVVPRQIMNPKLWRELMGAFDSAGVDPMEFQVGSPSAQINSLTGQEMFAFKDPNHDPGPKSGYSGRDPTSQQSSNTGRKSAGTSSPIGSPTSSSTKSGVARPSISSSQPAKTIQSGLTKSGTIATAPAVIPTGVKGLAVPNPDWRIGALMKDVPFTDDGWLTFGGLNYGSVPVNNQLGEIGRVDTIGFSPTRAAADLAGLVLPGAGLIGAGLDALGVMPDDWMRLNALEGGVESDLGPSPESDNDNPSALQRAVSPTTPRPSTGFTRPQIPQAPVYLGLSSGMSPLQIRSRIATYATNADDSRYREKEVSDYYDRLLGNSLIGDDGKLGDLSALLPIEQQYLLNSRMLKPWTTTSDLLKQLTLS